MIPKCFSINTGQSVGRMGEKPTGWNCFFNRSNSESAGLIENISSIMYDCTIEPFHFSFKLW